MAGFGWDEKACRASRGGFTRQAVNLARFEALTKVRPVRLPVRRRQAPVRFLLSVRNFGYLPLPNAAATARSISSPAGWPCQAIFPVLSTTNACGMEWTP